MKIENIAFGDTAVVTLVHPTTQEDIMIGGKPVTVTVYGTHTKQWQESIDAVANKRLANPSKVQTAEGIRAQSINHLVAATASLNNASELVLNGDKVGDKPNLKNIYTKNQWIRLQVDDAIGTQANFLIKD